VKKELMSNKTSNFGKQTAYLRLRFLVPLAVAIFSIITVFLLALYGQQAQGVDKNVIQIQASAQAFYDESVRADAAALLAIINALGRDEVLRTALARQDRQALLRRAAPLFVDLKRDYGITHFYFTNPARINLLRVHAPLRYGDVIDRYTTLQAEKSGTVFYGVELGVLGTFTLRLVAPWYDEKTQALLGYVELGMEIDHVLRRLRSFFGIEAYVLIYKEFLKQPQWEDGMRALGRTPHWERYDRVVLADQSLQGVNPLQADQIAHGSFEHPGELLSGPFSYRIMNVPLRDAQNRIVAQVVLLTDISQDKKQMRNTVYAGSFAALVVGVILFFFFYWQVGKVGKQIDRVEESLDLLATRDELTGLYNRRTFLTLISEELERANRYKHFFTLLLIDIDHFKYINDTYGHQAGDAILHSMSNRFMQQTRKMDRVCRYGGEEFTVVLPETDTESSLMVAERLLKAVAESPFDIGSGRAISVTVSIGIATYPLHTNEIESLFAAADSALYAAKHNGRNRVCVYEQTH
jgi:diguanylate cyclase (GGDEF)-like protein